MQHNFFFVTDSADEEDDSVVIHKKGRRDSRKRDDHGKAKKKARVVVEARFTTTRCLNSSSVLSLICDLCLFISSYNMSVLSLCQVELEDENVRRILKTVS